MHEACILQREHSSYLHFNFQHRKPPPVMPRGMPPAPQVQRLNSRSPTSRSPTSRSPTSRSPTSRSLEAFQKWETAAARVDFSPCKKGGGREIEDHGTGYTYIECEKLNEEPLYMVLEPES